MNKKNRTDVILESTNKISLPDFTCHHFVKSLDVLLLQEIAKLEICSAYIMLLTFINVGIDCFYLYTMLTFAHELQINDFKLVNSN